VAKVYLKNKDLLEEILISKENKELTPKAQQYFVLLANRVIERMHYTNENDKEDCLQTGLFDLFANWHNFDTRKSENAFAYFTEIFKRGIARGYGQLYKRKGDPDGYYKHISIESSNDGDGIYSI
jgi:DNA-directed RNA polymerase specialized sigma subunit